MRCSLYLVVVPTLPPDSSDLTNCLISTQYLHHEQVDHRHSTCPGAAFAPNPPSRDNELVAFTQTSFVDRQSIAAGVERAAATLRNTVVRIRYDFAEDWVGDPAIFFRVVLTDEVVRTEKPGQVGSRVIDVVSLEVNPEDQGLHAYFNFRTAAEQAELREPAWD